MQTTKHSWQVEQSIKTAATSSWSSFIPPPQRFTSGVVVCKLNIKGWILVNLALFEAVYDVYYKEKYTRFAIKLDNRVRRWSKDESHEKVWPCFDPEVKVASGKRQCQQSVRTDLCNRRINLAGMRNLAENLATFKGLLLLYPKACRGVWPIKITALLSSLSLYRLIIDLHCKKH